MVEIEAIVPKDVHANKPYVEQYIRSAIEHEPQIQDYDEVIEGCESGSYGLLVAKSNGKIIGVATLTFETFPLGKVCTIVTMGGDDFESWQERMFEVIETFAKSQFCCGVLAVGRRGWEKKRPDYAAIKTVFFKEI